MFVYRSGVKPGPLPRRRGTPAVFYAQSPCIILNVYITLLLLYIPSIILKKKMYSIYFCSILTSSTQKRRVGWVVGGGRRIIFVSPITHVIAHFARTYIGTTTPLEARPSLPPFGLPLFTIYFGRTRIVIFSDFLRSIPPSSKIIRNTRYCTRV